MLVDWSVWCCPLYPGKYIKIMIRIFCSKPPQLFTFFESLSLLNVSLLNHLVYTCVYFGYSYVIRGQNSGFFYESFFLLTFFVMHKMTQVGIKQHAKSRIQTSHWVTPRYKGIAIWVELEQMRHLHFAILERWSIIHTKSHTFRKNL